MYNTKELKEEINTVIDEYEKEQDKNWNNFSKFLDSISTVIDRFYHKECFRIERSRVQNDQTK